MFIAACVIICKTFDTNKSRKSKIIVESFSLDVVEKDAVSEINELFNVIILRTMNIRSFISLHMTCGAI